MSTMRSQDEIRNTVVSLGLPGKFDTATPADEHPYFMRRAARAMDLLDTGKVHPVGCITNGVNFVGDEIFRVQSQFDDTIYHVELNHGTPGCLPYGVSPEGCTCADHQKNPGVLCKHMIAATIYSKQAPAITIVKTTDGNESDYWRRCWLIAQGNRRTVVYEEHDGRLFCTCGAYYQDCKHKQLVIKAVTKELKAIAKPTSDCGTDRAKAIQEKLNGQIDSQNDNGNGATGGFVTADNHQQAPSQPTKLDLRDPFQQSEQLDIDQIEGRLNGQLVHKLSNGEYVISYQGIMTLSEKHHITFEALTHDDTHTVIAKARRNGSERVSGKPINGNETTAIELAKRNAARQLLPYAELKAVEKKAQLESEFSFKKAYDKCVKLVGGKAQLDCIIYDLVNGGKLRQDNPSHYDRTEWLIIHDACKQDASNDNNDGGDKTPSSNDGELNRYKVLAEAPVNANWRERHQECTKLVGAIETDLIIRQELNFRYSYYKNKITDAQWDVVLQGGILT